MLCSRSEVSVEEGFVHSSSSPIPTRACPQWQAGSFLRSWSVCQNHQRACLPPLSQTTAGYKHALLFCHAFTFCLLLSPTLYSFAFLSALLHTDEEESWGHLGACPHLPGTSPHCIYSEMQRVWWCMSISKLPSMSHLVPFKSLSVFEVCNFWSTIQNGKKKSFHTVVTLSRLPFLCCI